MITTILTTILVTTCLTLIASYKIRTYLEKRNIRRENRNVIKIRNILVNCSSLLSQIFDLPEDVFYTDEYHNTVQISEQNGGIIILFRIDGKWYIHIFDTEELLNTFGKTADNG